jgi:hypothetical protein
MHCPKCGKEAPDGAVMCKGCNYVFPIGLRDDGEPSIPGAPLPRPPGQQAAMAPAQPAYQQPPPQPSYQQPPPQAYQQPPPPAAQPGGVVPGVVTERSPLQIILLGMVTCGIYIWWWWYKTTEELKQATGDQSLNPGMDLLLVLLTGGIWGVYIEYRNCKKVHEVLAPGDPARKDQSQTVLIMRIVGLFIAFLAFYAIYLTQQEYNAMARTFG